jgi:hypothetical protein
VRVYIAGPIAGHPNGNRAAFAAKALELRVAGHDVVNPHHVQPWFHHGDCPVGLPGGEGAEHTAPCYMRSDLAEMLTCDAIYLLPGWEKSQGARIEFLVAVHVCGLKLMNPEAVPPHLEAPGSVLAAFGEAAA